MPTDKHVITVKFKFRFMMKDPCALIWLFSCFYSLVSAVDVACPPQGVQLGCICSKILDKLKVKCENTDQITHIPSWIPNNTNILEFEKCDIRLLNKDSFKDLVNLTTVKIQNQQQRLTFNDSSVFRGLRRLTEVDFLNNDLVTLPAGLFANLPQLTIIDLSDNALATLPDDLLENSTNLQHFRIANTRLDRDIIAKIGEGHFGKNIKSLLISGTYIQFLNDGLFSGLPQLNALGIGSCRIEGIGADILKGTDIRSISFDGNPISFINENAFRDSKVTTLECKGCQLISNVTFGGFLKKMLGLKILRLQNNNLTFVPKDAFAGLKDLYIIDLSNNNIATIEENPYVNLPDCDDSTCVQLHDNPLNCDCDLAWLRSFAANIKGNKDGWKCALPQSVAGKSLIKLELNQICNAMAKTTVGTTVGPTNGGTFCSICVMTVLFALAVIRLC